MLSPLDNKIIMACLTAAGSQRGIHLLDMIQIMNLMQEKIGQETATIQYKNMEISWQIHAENCNHSLQGTYSEWQYPGDSFVSLSFQILIH